MKDLDPRIAERDYGDYDVMPLVRETGDLLQGMGEIRGRIKNRKLVVHFLRRLVRDGKEVEEWVEPRAALDSFELILAYTTHLADRIEQKDYWPADKDDKTEALCDAMEATNDG